MRLQNRFTLIVMFIFLAFEASAQSAPIVSPEVSSDNRVTFRFRAPNAKEVIVDLEGAKQIPMQKDADGVWTATTEPLEPDYYGYQFLADGINLVDPVNPDMKPNLLSKESQVHVPGPSSLTWELNPVPHGVLHHHFYRSDVVGDQSDFYVYTPPSYDPKKKETYPTLYLLHGFSDDASGWTSVGRAHVILDNLIAQGKAKPMLIVMTLGYGAPEILKGGFGAFRERDLVKRNFDRYTQALLTEVIPQVENLYSVKKDAGSRAIAGLSMGGSESLLTGLNHLDKFNWVGSFSAGGLSGNFAEDFPKLDTNTAKNLKLLWISCGVDDGLIKINRQANEWLKSKNIKLTFVETPGAHTWMVWRRNLSTFVPLLFQGK
jgi:enterochelin esterase-like enzyme